MASARSYAVIGTGALGGFYGTRLAHAGCDLHFLLHTDYDHVRQHGLICESKDGDFSLPKVNAYRDTHDLPACDVVIVALKATANHLLPGLLPPCVHDRTAVLLMQNGLGGEEFLSDIIGADRVLGGLAFLCSNKVGPGHIRHLNYGLVTIGEHARPGITDRLEQIAADFQLAGIKVECLENLKMGRWQKLVWNIPYNGLSVIHDATTEELMSRPDTRQLVEEIMEEVVAAAAANDVDLPPRIVATMLERTGRMKPYRTSMKIDFDEDRPMEVEAIFGNPLRAAQAAGRAAPRIEEMYRRLTELNKESF